MDFHLRKRDTDNDTWKATAPYTASRRRRSPMTNKWRSDGNPRNRNPAPRQRDRSQSPVAAPPPRRPANHSAGRGRFNRDRNDFAQRPQRKRDYSPDPRRNLARRPSLSPARSPNRLPPGRNRYPGEAAYSSRDSSPARYSKRRRTRSPSPSDYSDRGFDERRRYSRSRSRERVEQRGARPSSRRGLSPRRSSPPRSARKGPRPAASDVDTYIPERRRPASPPSRQRPRRSPSPRPRSITPPSRRRSVTPPSRRYPSRPDSSSSRHNSPLPNRRGPRDLSPDPPVRRKATSRTPSVAGEPDQEHMEGPFAARGNHGYQNHTQRGRGQRPYHNNRGAYRGSPGNNATPNTSHQGSPTHSYHGGRGGWDGPQQHNQQYQNNQPYRQNNYQGGNQSQDEYYRSQQQASQQQHHHQYQNQSQRPYRGGRGQQRGGFAQHGSDRRFSGQDYPEAPFSQRGRGGQYQTAPWHQSRGRGGSQQVMTGPNSIRTSPAPPNRDVRDDVQSQQRDEQDDFRPPRGPQADNPDRRQPEQEIVDQDTPQSQKDASKFSFAFKSKPMPPSPAKPKASEPSEDPRPPPTMPASDRPPPTQPRGNKFQDKRPYNQSHPPPHNHNSQFDRRQDTREPPFRPPKGPQSQYNHHNTPDRVRQPPTEPRTRSRSPPPKKIKVEPPFKPTLTPEMAASDSIYFRKPGNESVVGAGTYGKVFKAIHIFTKDEVALKKIRMEGERDGFPITAVREIKLLQNLRHKHVVALQEVMVEKNECFMVFEYMSHDLTGVINHPTFKLSAAHKKDLGRQMFEGLEFLHRRGVMHRDIKAANLLISSHGQLKYADFGLARFYTKSRKLDYTNRVITIWYRPPELLLGETQYGPAVDIWSAACVFMEMFTKKAIFPGEGGELSQLEKIYNVLGTPASSQWPGITDLPWYELVHPAAATHPTSGERRRRVFEPQYEDVLSPAAMDLVTQIFAYDPAKRPDAATILEHDYFCVEEPQARQAVELAEVGGDWHEYESKAHRKENERKEKERRKEEHVREREREKRKTKEGKGKGIDEVPAAPMPIGEEEDTGGPLSDGEGSARMSMS